MRMRKKTMADGLPVVASLQTDPYIKAHEEWVARREQRTPTLPCIPVVELCAPEED